MGHLQQAPAQHLETSMHHSDSETEKLEACKQRRQAATLEDTMSGPVLCVWACSPQQLSLNQYTLASLTIDHALIGCCHAAHALLPIHPYRFLIPQGIANTKAGYLIAYSHL